MRTVYLRKSAAPVRIARGAYTVELTPGDYVDVPDHLLDDALASGATPRARPSGRDTDDPDDAGDGAEEE